MLLTSLSTFLLLAGSAQNVDSITKEFHQYFPYHQHLRTPYFQNGQSHNTQRISRNYPRGHTYHKNKAVPSHISSPIYTNQPQVRKQLRLLPTQTRHQKQLSYNEAHRGYQRKPILIQPNHKHHGHPQNTRNERRPSHVPPFNYRSTRKIEQTPLKLSKNFLSKKQPPIKTYFNKKETRKVASKNDNLAVESYAVETKVKVPQTSQFKTVGHKLKPQFTKSYQKTVKPVVAEVPVKRNYNSAPAPAAPKFIIQQAGKIRKIAP